MSCIEYVIGEKFDYCIYDRVFKLAMNQILSEIREDTTKYIEEIDFIEAIKKQIVIEEMKLIWEMAIKAKTIRTESRFYSGEAWGYVNGKGSITFIGANSWKIFDTIEKHGWGRNGDGMYISSCGAGSRGFINLDMVIKTYKIKSIDKETRDYTALQTLYNSNSDFDVIQCFQG